MTADIHDFAMTLWGADFTVTGDDVYDMVNARQIHDFTVS